MLGEHIEKPAIKSDKPWYSEMNRCHWFVLIVAALGYFVLPADSIPDILVGIGFTDDIAVLTAAIGAVRAHMSPAHRLAARQALAGQG